MKILIACNRDSYKNPYVSTLADGLIEQGVDVTCSISEFWNNATAYDIIHVMWPNLLVDRRDEDCKKLQSVIAVIKKASKVFMCTCHNIKPHYNDGVAINNAYRIIYESCDCIHHLGEASIKLLQEAYPNISARSVVIPHHTYDKLYNLNVSKEEARKKLNIPQTAKVIMSFGSFRDDEERKLVMDLSDKLGKEYYFLMPGFYVKHIWRKNIIRMFKTLKDTLRYTLCAKLHHLHIAHSFVPDEILPYYMAAADVMVIQRVKILNSGNVSLAMLAGLPIVGPNIGNIKDILENTGNALFDINNSESLSAAVLNILKDTSLGNRNKSFAEDNLTTSAVTGKLKEVYNDLI